METVRGAVIGTSGTGACARADIPAELEAQPALPGRRALVELIGPVEQGCESELGILAVCRARAALLR